MTLATLLIILALVVLLFGGSLGQERLGYWSWSPAAVLVLVLLILWLAGRLS
jgi:hypothetical protein